MDVTYLERADLSWRAKGFYSWLLIQPELCTVADALESFPHPMDTHAAIIELQNAGLIQAGANLLGVEQPTHEA